MRTLLVIFLIAALPFLTGNMKSSFALHAQQEEMMEEESPKKPEKKKEEAKPAQEQTKQTPAANQQQNKDIKPPEEKTPEVKSPDTKTPVQLEEQPSESPLGKNVPENLKYYREKYVAKYDKPFEIVWNAIKKAISDLPCQIASENYKASDDGLYKGIIRSDFCVFVTGEDSTFKRLKRYSFEMPVIRGGIWVTGRMQYKFIVKEDQGGGVSVILTSEMSGMEQFVTKQVQFWKSNGVMETEILAVIRKNCDETPQNKQ